MNRPDIRPLKLAAAIASQNEVNRLVNEFAPKLRQAMRSFIGKKVINADGSRTKAVGKALEGILPEITTKFHYWRSSDLQYVFYINTFYAYPGETHGSSIQKAAAFHIGKISNTNILESVEEKDPQLKTDYKAEDILKLREEHRAAEKALDEIRSKLSHFGTFDN